jgi:hypothetical protein
MPGKGQTRPTARTDLVGRPDQLMRHADCQGMAAPSPHAGRLVALQQDMLMVATRSGDQKLSRETTPTPVSESQPLRWDRVCFCGC